MNGNALQRMIWKVAPFRSDTLLLFLALSEWADPETGAGWTVSEALMAKTRQTRRNLQYCIARLKAEGWLEWEGKPGRGKLRIAFRINAQRLRDLYGKGAIGDTEKGANFASHPRVYIKPNISNQENQEICSRCSGTGQRASYSLPGKIVPCECQEQKAVAR